MKFTYISTKTSAAVNSSLEHAILQTCFGQVYIANYAAWLDFEWKIVLALLKIQVLVRYDSFEQVYKIFIYSTGAIRNFVSVTKKYFALLAGKF
jgi:hypothetical protein